MGVASRMPRTSRPAVASARTADSRPEPGPLTRTSTVRRPTSFALFAAVSAACCAANGVPLREPRNPSDPALDQETVLPSGSAIVMIVLLNVAWMCTMPLWTMRFSFFLTTFFLAVFAGAFAILSLCRFLLARHSTFARSLTGTRIGVAALSAHRQATAMPQTAIRSHLDVPLDVQRHFLAKIAF